MINIQNSNSGPQNTSPLYSCLMLVQLSWWLLLFLHSSRQMHWTRIFMARTKWQEKSWLRSLWLAPNGKKRGQGENPIVHGVAFSHSQFHFRVVVWFVFWHWHYACIKSLFYISFFKYHQYSLCPHPSYFCRHRTHRVAQLNVYLRKFGSWRMNVSMRYCV